MFLVRIAGGALLVAAELVTPQKTSLYTAAYILQSVGLSPLLLATIGFIGLVYVSSTFFKEGRSDASVISGQHAFSESPKMSRTLRLIGGLTITAMAIAIAGGVNQY